eukprot:Em0015g28a
MYEETDRTRKPSAKTGYINVVNPEQPSDQTTIQNVFGFIQNYVPQAVAGSREEKKEKVLWAIFEQGDLNDPNMTHHDDTNLPLLLILGFATGYSVWMLLTGGDATEIYSAYGEAEVAKIVRLMKTPECHPSVDQDSFADLRPILAVVKKGRHYTNAAPFSTLYFVPLRGASHEDEGRLKKLVFKGSTIMDVKCNRRVIAIVLQKKVVILDAGSHAHKFSVKNGYPLLSHPCNPIALGTRWLAFAETKLIPKLQSIGGLSDTTKPSVAATVIQMTKKGISALSESLSAKPPEIPEEDGNPETVSANVVSVIDVNHRYDNEVFRLQDMDMDKETGVVAHFTAHTGAGVHIAAIAFNPSGTLLVTACTEGHDFHVFSILPHPWFSSESAVHHLYTLHRGATSGVVQDICFSGDSRWIAVSTLNGTTHVFPITPYGGAITVRTHLPVRVVNQLSRFHTSAGIEVLPQHPSCASIARKNSFSPPKESIFPVASLGGGVGPCNWCNPRALPLPVPVQVGVLQQIKQPYVSTGSSSNTGTTTGSRPDPDLTLISSLAGPDSICVRAWFSPTCDRKTLGMATESCETGAVYSLYVLGNGTLTAHQLEPQQKAGTNEGDDAPIELLHTSKTCWKLLSKPHPPSTALPLSDKNPLVAAYEEYKQSCLKNARPSDGMTKTEGEWLAQVEILTHAPPPRRIWMGPQFSFKTYQASFTSSLQATPPLQADSMVDSGEGSGGSETIKSTNDSAVLPSSEGPLADLLADPLDQSNAVQSIHSNPMSMPLTPGASNTDKERGIVEVFGSWKNVAPYLEGYTEEVERQHLLEDAISDSATTRVTIAAGSSNITPLRGFNPRVTK